MNPAKDLKPSASSFSVTKHSWKGKYKRVLSVGPEVSDIEKTFLKKQICNPTKKPVK